ncbi:MAG: phage portal protein, partial [Pseudomonadota bacterium]
HPITALFQNPNPEQTGSQFIEQLVWDLAADGNAFSLITPGPLGAVSGLTRLDPARITIGRDVEGLKAYTYREPGKPEKTLLDEEVWHIAKPPMFDGMRGLSPIHAGREVIAAALAMQKYAARFFNNSGVPPYFFKHPGKFPSAEKKQIFLNAIARWLTGHNQHKPAVIEDGIEVEKLGVTNEEAQFLETRKQMNVELCRLWRIPPHKVGILDRATFSNIEEQSLDYVTGTLMPWLQLIEASIGKHLIQAADRYAFEFNVAGLLRGDIAARYSAYSVARQWGWLSVNEIRRLESLNPIGAGGDTYLQPMNMAPAGAPLDDATARALSVLRRSALSDRPAARPMAPPPHMAARPSMEFRNAA